MSETDDSTVDSETMSAEPEAKSYISKLQARIYRNRILLSVISATFILANLIIFAVDGPFPTSPQDHQLVHSSSSSNTSSSSDIYNRGSHSIDNDAEEMLRVMEERGIMWSAHHQNIPPPVKMGRQVRKSFIRINWWLVKRVLLLTPLISIAAMFFLLIDYRVVSVWARVGADWASIRLASNWVVVQQWIQAFITYFQVDLAYYKVRRLLQVWGWLAKPQ